MDKKDKVKALIGNSGLLIQFCIITSREKAESFVVDFMGISEYITLVGCCDDADANPVTNIFKREELGCVRIMEINSF